MDALAGYTADLGHPHAEQNVDALVAEEFEEGFADIRVFAGGELRSSLDEGDLAAKSPHGLTEFECDVTAAQDDDVAGNAVELESLDMGHRPGSGQPRNVGNRGPAAHIQKDTVSLQTARA